MLLFFNFVTIISCKEVLNTDASGSFTGSAVTSGSTTRFYDASGSYTGQQVAR